MTLEELKIRCEENNIQYAYGKFKERVDPPHLVAITRDTDNFMADNIVYNKNIPIQLDYTYLDKDIETENKYAKVTVEKIDSLAYSDTNSNIKRLSTKKTLDLNSGDNYFKVTVTSENKETTNEYKIKISVIESVSIFGKQYSVIQKEPTLTTSSNNTNDESGLYKSIDTNTGDPTYYFRGNVENNYVSFAGFTWRIVRINEDGTIRIIMQDGINNNATYKFNSNNNNYTYMYYSNSEAKTVLENWYQINIGSKDDLIKNIVSGDYYCEQIKVKYHSSYTTGQSSVPIYQEYEPNFKCETDGNGKGMINSNVGLITYDEMVFTGGYYYIENNKYFLFNGFYSWTMSPSGVAAASGTKVWGIYDHDIANIKNGCYVSSSLTLRPVVNLKSGVQVSSGTGTKENPFVVE